MKSFIVAIGLLLPAFAAWAQSTPTSPEARPRGEPASQSSVPTSAPSAGTGRTTGATNQDPTIKQMNDAEKAKVDSQGK